MILLIFNKKEISVYFNKCFTNVKKAVLEYEKENLDIHTYIWIYLKKPTKKKIIIKIKKTKKKIKKISYIF
jgi:hypothetical protein